VQRQRDEYDAAGIAADDAPPAALMAEVGPKGIVVSSDLPRAIESAERLAPGEPIPVSPLLRETPLEIPTRLPLRMPLAGWEALMHARWTLQIANGSDASPKDLTRAHAAADWLVRLSREHSPVVALTHGVFRRLLADRLMTMGWRSDPAQRSYALWSAWSFERDFEA
jgi:broad specificity phosphatase PhoE